MAIGKGGSTGNQSGSQSGNYSGSVSGTNQSDTTQTGTTSGTTSGTSSGSVSANPTAGYLSVSDLLRGNMGNTGLNAGQTTAFNDLQNWISNPNNTTGQIAAVAPQIQSWIGAAAPQAGATSQIAPTSASAFMDQYTNPYTQSVVNATEGDLGHGLETALNDVRASYGGQMGNGREGVAAQGSVNDFIRSLATADAGLRSQGFTTAAGLGSGDATRAQEASAQNAGNTLNLNEFNTGLDASKQNQNLGAMQDIVGNAATAGNFGNQSLEALYGMAGGGNTNLLQYLQSQVPAFGQSSTGTQTGSQTGTTTGSSNTMGSTTGSSSGSSSGYNSGSSNGKNGGISFG